MHHHFHILVGMSGGVDSAVSAYLLKKAGHKVEAILMKNWEEDGECTFSQDFLDAQTISDQLKINLTIVNFSTEYWGRVFAHFLEEYRLGRTPNPDILCNKEIKFRAFLDYAKNQGADYIATGHYVRKKQTESGSYLLKGIDSAKDQSYFLHTLSEKQIAQSLFPVGDLTKKAVRALAQEIRFKNHAKKDSTGICFIGERKFKTFLNDYLPAKPGSIETLDGEILGQHDGLMFYTIGQRQGLKIGGKQGKAEAPWYVVRKDMNRNVLIVVQGEHSALYQPSLIASHIHWINGQPFSQLALTAKIRYRQADQTCHIETLPDQRLHVIFSQPQRAVTPGQSIVFYQDDICLGGGIIES